MPPITERNITVNLKVIWFWATGLGTGIIIVLSAYYGIQGEISDLKHQIEMLTYRTGVLEKIQDKRN